MARASHGLYRPQESLPSGVLPFPVPFPRLASLRGFTAPTMLRSTTGRREGSAGHTHDF